MKLLADSCNVRHFICLNAVTEDPHTSVLHDAWKHTVDSNLYVHSHILRLTYPEPGCATGEEGILSLVEIWSGCSVGEAGPVVTGDEGGTPSNCSDKAGTLGFLLRSLDAVNCFEGLYPGDFRSPLYLFC